jgi:hypothetical protein
MNDVKQVHAYAAQDVAFDDTKLDERPGYRTLVADTEALTSNRWWADRGLPQVTIEQIVSNSIGGDAGNNHVRYTHTAPRRTVAHELAHVATDALVGHGVQPHGPEWRGLYVALVSVLYGHQYGARLHKAFLDNDLDVDLVVGMPHTTPLVDIDKLGGVIQGGWRR